MVGYAPTTLYQNVEVEKMEETWKDIDGFVGYYQISNFGNVKSLNYQNHGKEKILKPKKNNKGYLWVELRKNGIKKCLLIHRLVASNFLENKNNYEIVNHKDENPLNNSVLNLEWCTQTYNVRYSLERHQERLKRKDFKPSSNYRKHDKKLCKLDNDNNVIEIFESVSCFCRKFNKNEWSIIQCCEGKRKTAYGYKWKFAD